MKEPASWRTRSSAIAERLRCFISLNISLSLKVVGNSTIQLIAYQFLLALHSDYDPILYHFRDKARYWSKIFFITILLSTPKLGAPRQNICFPFGVEQELIYRKEIARQLRTQYVEGTDNNPLTSKPRLKVTQGDWKWNHCIDHTRLIISRVIWRWIISWHWNLG